MSRTKQESIELPQMAEKTREVIQRETGVVMPERETFMIGHRLHGALEGVGEDGVNESIDKQEDDDGGTNEGSDEHEPLNATGSRMFWKTMLVGMPALVAAFAALRLYNWFSLGALTVDGFTTGGLISGGLLITAFVGNKLVNWAHKPARRKNRSRRR